MKEVKKSLSLTLPCREGKVKWERKKLGEIATYINGFAFKPSDWVEKGRPIIRIQNLTDVKTKCNFSNRQDIPEKFHVADGDILISWSATLGVYEWLGGDAWLNQHIFKVVFDKINIDKYYFKYIIENSLSEMSKHTNGATMKHIRKGDFDNIQIPVPPLSEQQDIVRYLDESFAKIDALKANAEKSLADAKALFQAELKKAMEPKEGWEEKKLGEVADIKGGKRVPKGYKLQSEPTLHKYIRVADFNDCGSVDLSDIQYISDDVFEQIKRYTISTEDVYISIAGTIGKSGIIPEELEGANLTENACKLVLDKNLDKRFVYYFTQSNLFKKQIDILTKKSAQPKLALTRLAIVELAYPSLSEQQSIVTHLDTLSAKVTQLQQNLEKIKTECDALKQALLKQVFK